MTLTKSELASLAELVRLPAAAPDAVLWAVSYNIPLFLWGVQDAAKTIEAIVLACNQGCENNLIKRIGLDRLEEFDGKNLIQLDRYGKEGFVKFVPDKKPTPLSDAVTPDF